jgi:mannose-1-phosphate guanylyltransferase
VIHEKAMKKQKIIPVILSGGIGSRLWPLSRALYPKQLQSLVSDKSLLQETVIRSSGTNFDSPLVICNEEHRFIVAEHIREINVIPRAIILEPVGCNTAPAAAVADWLENNSSRDNINFPNMFGDNEAVFFVANNEWGIKVRARRSNDGFLK